MPQMAPLMWLSLFIFFLLMYLLFNIMNYFSFMINNSSQENNKMLNKNTFNWKW
uniref:ATP synthase complex subunit 8 n=1 Tax=Trichopygomyia trichopyga TaxID=1807786 RepID=A0A343AWE2_9DIPT|nr:ATP synthase F0 subunit 8 [Trichopygomyia trichopyga]